MSRKIHMHAIGFTERVFKCPATSCLLALKLDVTSSKKMCLTTKSKIHPPCFPFFPFIALTDLYNYVSAYQHTSCLPSPVYCELHDSRSPCLFPAFLSMNLNDQYLEGTQLIVVN